MTGTPFLFVFPFSPHPLPLSFSVYPEREAPYFPWASRQLPGSMHSVLTLHSLYSKATFYAVVTRGFILCTPRLCSALPAVSPCKQETLAHSSLPSLCSRFPVSTSSEKPSPVHKHVLLLKLAFPEATEFLQVH